MGKRQPLTVQVLAIGLLTWLLLCLTNLRNTLPLVLPWMSLALAVFILFTWRGFFKHKFSPLKHLPGPKAGHFLFGHIQAVFDHPLGSIIGRWMRDIPNSGLIYFRGYLGSEYVVVTSITGVTEVLTTRAYDFHKASALKRYTRRFIGQGLIIEEGEAHADLRKLVAPVFINRRVNTLKPLLTAKAEQLVGTIHGLCDAEGASLSALKAVESKSVVLDVSDLASRSALDVACMIAFGVDPHATSDLNSAMFLAYQSIFGCESGKKQQFMWHNSAPQWLVNALPSPVDVEMDKAFDSVRSIVRDAVVRRMSGKMGDEHSVLELDYLAQLIRAGTFSVEQCVGQILIILAAGHETTASTIAWIVNELAMLPELQAELRSEMDQAKTEGRWDEDTIDTLPLLNGVCQEALRLHPAVPLTLRTTVRDTMIDGQAVPTGTYVVVVPDAINKSEQFWGPDAAQFNPRRWICRNQEGIESVNPTGGARSNYCMETFLHGPRGCIGRNVAIVELRRIAAVLVQSFQIEVVDGELPESIGFITVKPRPGHRVRLRVLD